MNTNENKRAREISHDDEADGMMKNLKLRSFASSSICSHTSSITEQNTTTTAPTFAPSFKEYLKQVPQHNKDDKVVLKYLPRPEWCYVVQYIIYKELKNVKHIYNFAMTDAMGMAVQDYHHHLKRCVTNRRVPRGILYFSNSTDEEESDCDESNEYMSWIESDFTEEGNKEVMGNSSSDDHDNEIKQWNDTSKVSTSDKMYSKSYIRERIDFVTALLTSNFIYFDMDRFIWKTRVTKEPLMNRTHPHDTMSLRPDQNYQIPYETLIQRQRDTKRSIGKGGNTILHLAIQANATEVALEIIRIEYQSFLHIHDRSDGLTEYLGIRTFLEAANKKGYTPMILAAQKGNIQIVEELLNCGVAVNGVSKNCWDSSVSTAILQAAEFGQTKVIAHMIEYYKRHHATRSVGSMSEVWPKTLKALVDEPNGRGTTPLMRAAQKGHMSIVKILLQNDATVDGPNDFGMSPLMHAALRGDAKICQCLIDYGADINFRINEKKSALSLACIYGHVTVVKTFIAAGCELHHSTGQGYTIRWEMQTAIIRRRAAPVTPIADMDRTLNDSPATVYFEAPNSDVDDDDENENEDTLDFFLDSVPQWKYRKILYMLDPQVQIELMQLSKKVQRNYEIIRLHMLLLQERVDIKFRDGSTCAVPTVVQRLANVKTKADDSDSNVTLESSFLSELPRSTQMLLHTMVLPAALVQAITLFLPLPTLWTERMERLDEFTIGRNPNEAVVLTLDMIDEILEEGGFLSACDQAQIPAPIPHPSWCDWKRSAEPIALCSVLHSKRWIPPNENPFEIERLSITASSSPVPCDEKRPSIRELRRFAGYLSLLSQHQFTTNILTVLSEEPYSLPHSSLKQLIRIADMASLCRRCVESRGSIEGYCIAFDEEVATDLCDLADELLSWCVTRT